ncbi:hypothetical protein FB446DRAFT_260348 [Lentinula raphanica]|nr:hypothetical protein FB446DRAFT_260348 [Lentinula raphanica]
MRPSVLLSLAALLLSSTMAMPLDARTLTEDLEECGPATTVEARELLEGILERRTPKAAQSAAVAFIKYMQTNSAKLTKAPVFWTGKYGRKGAKQAADVLKTKTEVVGSHGGFTVFDVLKEANIPTTETAKWKPDPDWRAVCGAFAEYAQPADKKAHFVYGPEYDKQHNIWADDEWPALEKNSAVAEVLTYEMNADGKSWTEKGEIKASHKGSPIHSANNSPHASDVE